MLLSPAVVFGTGGPWQAEVNKGTTVWYVAAVACLGSSSSCSNTGLTTVACRGNSSCSNTGLAAVACFGSSSSCSNTDHATVACRGSSSRSNTGLAAVACCGSSSSNNTGLVVVACRGSSSNSSNGLAAVGFLISINVAPMLSLPPGRRDNSNRCSNRQGIPTIGCDGEDGGSPLSETFFGGDGGAVQEGFQAENVEMPMFSLLEGLQQSQSAPTAVALAAAAPAAEAMTGTRVFPDVSSKGEAEAPTSSAGAAWAAVPAAAPPTGGTIFPTTSVGGGSHGARFCR